jgi:hypothetical protein
LRLREFEPGAWIALLLSLQPLQLRASVRIVARCICSLALSSSLNR